jgi:hypothetical protein
MSAILYYSNFCEKCKSLLQRVARSSKRDDLHYVCIDKRQKGDDGSIHVVLENGQTLLLPTTIVKVPALLQLNNNNSVLFGNEIMNYLEPVIHTPINTEVTNVRQEPTAFSITHNNTGVISDNFCFLDMSADELSAKGSGGLRQQHQYTGLNDNYKIDTPSDDYVPDKISNDSSCTMENIIQQREQDIKGVSNTM